MIKDKIFNDEKIKISDFKFDKKVSRVFDDMVKRSVPGYADCQRLICYIARTFLKPMTNVYDLGSATGETFKELLDTIPDIPEKKIKLIGYDNSRDIIDFAKKKVDLKKFPNVSFIKADLSDYPPIDNASLVLMNWTLQFIRPLKRLSLLQHIHSGLCDEGVLVLFEKVTDEDSFFNRLFIDFFYQWKKDNGYTETEIAKKREALENVLIPFTQNENLELIKNAGFSKAQTIFRWVNFMGFVAFK